MTRSRTTPAIVAGILFGTPMSNTDPFAMASKPDDERIDAPGARIMVQIPEQAALKNVSMDWKNGDPWIMWAGTPYAHLMISIDGPPSH